MSVKVYQIEDFSLPVRMKLTIDWEHPNAESWIREMSMFWSGHPGTSAPIEDHLEFFINVMATRAYALSREDKFGFSAEAIHKLVFDSEGFCGSAHSWIQLSNFVDETADTWWEFKEVKNAD